MLMSTLLRLLRLVVPAVLAVFPALACGTGSGATRAVMPSGLSSCAGGLPGATAGDEGMLDPYRTRLEARDYERRGAAMAKDLDVDLLRFGRGATADLALVARLPAAAGDGAYRSAAAVILIPAASPGTEREMGSCFEAWANGE